MLMLWTETMTILSWWHLLIWVFCYTVCRMSKLVFSQNTNHIFLQIYPFFNRMFLQVVETADELLIGKRRNRRIPGRSSQYGQRESRSRIRRRHVQPHQCGTPLQNQSDFFFYLIPYLFPFFPVETYLEEHTIKEGKNLKDMSLEEMDAIWNEAKKKGL